jgi:trans-AT polyketide synthase, acyltransferase and oxidoreductase domains
MKRDDIVLTETPLCAEKLGCPIFRKEYNLRHAYMSGAMYKGIASKELVVRMGKGGYMGFLGTGGLRLEQIESGIDYIQRQLKSGEPYGMNFLAHVNNPTAEMALVDLYLQRAVRHVEAAAFTQISPALVKYRLRGLVQSSDTRSGTPGVVAKNKIIAKVSRPEIAKLFLSPAPKRITKRLWSDGEITQLQYDMADSVPMADDICVEADSGGHTDMGVASTLVPTIIRLRDQLCREFAYDKRVRVGASGGIGTPEAAAAAFVLGADFIVTGSINQCTVEAGTSDEVKDMLESISVQDTAYAPAGDMFELGSKIQVLKKGVFFPARANHLYDLWRQFNSYNDIDIKTRKKVEEKYFRCSFDDVYRETKKFYLKTDPQQIDRAEKNEKHKMALVFRWYFIQSTKFALSGDVDRRVEYQVQCGPALGAFNQWVKGTRMESWRHRHVDEVGEKLMLATAQFLSQWYRVLAG